MAHEKHISALFDQLASAIAQLGESGGQVSVSIYETAQLYRLQPDQSPKDRDAIRHWLMSEQHPDGAWGDPVAPAARMVSTLAVLCALWNDYGPAGAHAVCRNALHWIHQNAQTLMNTPRDVWPVGMELILPYLLGEAQALGIDVPVEPFRGIMAQGAARRAKLARIKLRGGSTHAHSWESFGTTPDPILIDGAGSVSHNPSATATWLRATEGQVELGYLQQTARQYLARCVKGTDRQLAGAMPGVWPLDRFELVFGLYLVYMAGLLDHPQLQPVLRPQLDRLYTALKPNGLGLSDHFVPDGDDTAAALIVLRAANYPVTLAPLAPFTTETHFCGYPGELHGSVSLTARGIQAHHSFDAPTAPYLAYIVENQQPDGCWLPDKWHASWLYVTCHAVIALVCTHQHEEVQRACAGILQRQLPNGAWGSAEETAYAILALRTVQGWLPELVPPDVLERAEQWMRSQQDRSHAQPSLWIGKDLYSPVRIVQIANLSAMIPTTYAYEAVA